MNNIIPAKEIDVEENGNPLHLKQSATFFPKPFIITDEAFKQAQFGQHIQDLSPSTDKDLAQKMSQELVINDDEFECWKNRKTESSCIFTSPVDCWLKKEFCTVHPKSDNVFEIQRAFEEDYQKTIQRNVQRNKMLNVLKLEIDEEIKKMLEKIEPSAKSEDCSEAQRSLAALYENLETLTSLYSIAIDKTAYGEFSWDWIEGIWDFILARYPSFQAKKAHAEHTSFKNLNDFEGSFAVFSAWKNEYIEQAKLSDSQIENILKIVDEQYLKGIIQTKETFDPEWVEKRRIDKSAAIQFFSDCIDDAKYNFKLDKRKNIASMRRELIFIANSLLEEPLKKRICCERAWSLFNCAMGVDSFTCEKAYNIYIALAPGNFKTPPLTTDYHIFTTSEDSLNNFLDSTYEKINQD